MTGLLFAVVGVSGIGLFLMGEANQARCVDDRCDPGDDYTWAGFLGMGLVIVGILFLGAGVFRRWGW